jgi:undecaprenyl-diphosphatase
MNLNLQLTRAFIVSLISLLAFSLMAFLINANKIVHFDKMIIRAVQGFEAPVMTTIMEFFTFIGSTPAVVVISLLIIFFLFKVLHHKSELILFIIAIVGSPILNFVLKGFFQRARPDFHRLIEIGGYSFPSGHAMNAFTVYGMLAFLLWRNIFSRSGRSWLIVFSTFMIGMIGVSRIYLGVHYPSDIIGGYFASGFWLSSSLWFFQRYQDRQPVSERRLLRRS